MTIKTFLWTAGAVVAGILLTTYVIQPGLDKVLGK